MNLKIETENQNELLNFLQNEQARKEIEQEN